MRMRKECGEKDCRSSPKCEHPWWMTFSRVAAWLRRIEAVY